MKTKPNIHKINEKLIKDNWEKLNIKLLGEFKRGGKCDMWYNKFKFIEEDFTIKNSVPTTPIDRNKTVYCNSYYVAEYLENNGGISSEVLKAYEEQLNKLAQGQVIC